MNPERARELRDELRHRAHLQPGLTPQPGSRKQRELRFDKMLPAQVEQAHQLLTGLEGLEIKRGAHGNSLSISYFITDYTLEGLETALIGQGFHLESTLYSKLVRALIYFCEETQLRNMRMPERLIKKSNEVYVKAWEHHSHGDHDDTPPELREYK